MQFHLILDSERACFSVDSRRSIWFLYGYHKLKKEENLSNKAAYSLYEDEWTNSSPCRKPTNRKIARVDNMIIYFWES